MLLSNVRYIKKPQTRLLHQCLPRFSLADKIKTFLPSLGLVDEMQPSLPQEFREYAERRLKQQNLKATPKISAEKKEVALAQLFRRRNQLPEAVKTVISKYSFAESMQILEKMVLEPETDSEMWNFRLRELCFLLIKMNNAPLATQLILDEVQDSDQVLAELELVAKLYSIALPETRWDSMISDNLGVRFPQVLQNPKIHCWTRVQLLRRYVEVCTDKQRATVLARKCLNSGMNAEAMYAYLHGNDNWKEIMKEMTSDQNKSEATIRAFFTGAVNAVETQGQLKELTKYLHKIPAEMAPKLTQTALKLQRPFELAKITDFFHAAIDNSLLANAFTAFIWHNANINTITQPTQSHFDQNILLSDPNYALPIKLLRVLEPSQVEFVATRAIKSLTQPAVPPPRALWSLLLSLDFIKHRKSDQLEKALGFLMFKRPLMEQLRYMSLSTTLPVGIAHLVYLSSQKTGQSDYHDSQFEKKDWAEAKLLCAATLLLSEKEKECTQFSDKIQALFQNWSIPEANKLLDSVNGHTITSKVSGNVLSMLDRSRKYKLVLFLLSEFDLKNVPPNVVYRLLQHSAEHDYRSFSKIFIWCQAKKNHCFLQAQVLRDLVVILSRNHSISNTTVMKCLIRVNKILAGRQLMLGPEACTEFVNRLISDAEIFDKGSVLRLHWALKLAEQNDVLPASVERWQLVLGQMREKETGFWAAN